MLRQRASLAEVNFWAPSVANFCAPQLGENLLFNLDAPIAA
jgi:putative restriction endonuclease